MRPGVFADAFVGAPQFPADGAVSAWVRVACRLAIFDDLTQVDGHVRVDVEDYAVDDEAAEAADQPLAYHRALQVVSAIKQPSFERN